MILVFHIIRGAILDNFVTFTKYIGSNKKN